MADVNAVHVQEIDSCVTVTSPCTKGDVVHYMAHGKQETVTCNEDVPIYHKVAITAVKSGDAVYKYGAKIGIATKDIKVGDWVHIHNIKPVGFIE